MALLTLAAAFVVTVVTYAGGGSAECAPLPRASWISPALARSNAEHRGYRVAQVRADAGCYVVAATGPDGAAVELRLDPVSGDLVRRDAGTGR
ncbi:MAG: PepSY domain-containing protein [Geminicoccaceae bacterium]